MMITIVYVHPLKQKSGGGKATPSKFNFPYLNFKKKYLSQKKFGGLPREVYNRSVFMQVISIYLLNSQARYIWSSYAVGLLFLKRFRPQ